VCGALAACTTRTDVSATANVPAQYAHVWVTVQAVWFNTSATAGPADSGWQQFTLASTETLDLVGLNNGVLSQLAQQLKVPAGTYAEVRLLLTDATASLTSSAQSAGAQFNDEVDYYDAAGVLHQVALQLPNAAQGIAVPASLDVKASTNTLFSSSSTTSSSSTSSTSSSSSSTVSALSSTPTASLAVVFDAEHDLVPLTLSGQPAYLLNAHLSGYDLSAVGNIAGQLDVSALQGVPGTEQLDVEVSAETLSSDGTRHVVIASAPVSSSGSFVLYPLSTASGAPAQYDLVVHGGGLGTVIVQSVPVTSGAPTGSATVQLGTITLAAANSYTVNAPTGTTLAPAGASVGFYQTLPGSGEVPYLIERRAMDSFAGNFAADQALSGADLSYGTYSTSMTLASAPPAQGSGTYDVALSATLYGDGALTTTVAPPTGGATGPMTFTPAALAIPTGASADSVAGTVSVTTPGKYDKGEILLTRDGSVIASAPLDAYLSHAQSSATLLSSVPGGSTSATYASGVYDLEVWVWNSSDPLGTLTREPASSALDLSSGSSTGLALSIS